MLFEQRSIVSSKCTPEVHLDYQPLLESASPRGGITLGRNQNRCIDASEFNGNFARGGGNRTDRQELWGVLVELFEFIQYTQRATTTWFATEFLCQFVLDRFIYSLRHCKAFKECVYEKWLSVKCWYSGLAESTLPGLSEHKKSLSLHVMTSVSLAHMSTRWTLIGNSAFCLVLCGLHDIKAT